MHQWISLVGLLAMIGCAWLLSAHKRRISLRIIAGGLLLQFAFALVVLKTDAGAAFFRAAGDIFKGLLSFVDAGAGFLFAINRPNDAPSLDLLLTFAFSVLPTVVFFASLMSILYFLGVMQWIVRGMGWVVRRTLGTTGPESLAAAGNIFVGHTEAPLMVRPYVSTMTRSELMALMVPGFGSTAGGVLAAYVGMGIDAGHLITASVMSAPAGLLIAKVMQPEVEQPSGLDHVSLEYDPKTSGSNLLEAAAIGATDGMKLAINIAAMLIAFLALIKLVDFSVGWVGGRFGLEWSLGAAFSYVFAPFAWLMGIPWEDCLPSGELLGVRIVANEFIAYDQLSRWMRPESAVQLSDRSVLILTYALSGFANFGSIGVQIGGIGAIAPERQRDLASLGMRAMLGGMLACFMTACVAGFLLPE
jgi:CNT family concentrative nucleoside transporter